MPQTQTRAIAPASPKRAVMARTERGNYEVTFVPSKDIYSSAACSMCRSREPQYVVPRKQHGHCVQHGRGGQDGQDGEHGQHVIQSTMSTTVHDVHVAMPRW